MAKASRRIRLALIDDGEAIFAYPLFTLRLATTTPNSTASTVSVLHRDALGSVRGVTGADGLRDGRSVCRPFGGAEPYDFDAARPDESHGCIGALRQRGGRLASGKTAVRNR